MMQHFLSQLYQALYRTTKNGWACLKLSERLDLHLMQAFLSSASQGMSIKNIVYRKPTHLYRSDASEFGMGGYNILAGKAWRFELPVDCRLRTCLNSLEFMALTITIWLDILTDSLDPESCILSQTDSSSAAGWLHKSNYTDDTNSIVQLTTARHVATLFIDAHCCLDSQWFVGGGMVSDCLSCDFHLGNASD